MRQAWPDRLWIVRHGESAGNVAFFRAEAAGLARLDLDIRDADVPLSELGEQQSRALGGWFAVQPEDQQPEIVLVSPYLRASQTAALISDAAGFDRTRIDFVEDERLREKELGVIDFLTEAGVAERYPEQAQFRRVLGKFYHRPPGGESWCDVILRLRSVLDTMSIEYSRRRVLIVTHQVVVLCFRYLLERLTEAQLLAIDREGRVANCGITEYFFDAGSGKGGGLRLHRYNFTAPVSEAGSPVTSAPDVKTGVR